MNEGKNIFRFESSSNPGPEAVQLNDMTPLYHLLLEDSAAGVVNTEAAQEAHDRIRDLYQKDPQAVLSCDGKSPEEARKILASIEDKHKEAA